MNFLRGMRRSQGDQAEAPASEQTLIEQKLEQIDEALREIGEAPCKETAAVTNIGATDNGHTPVVVAIGNSQMAREMPGFVDKLISMVNRSYGCMRVDKSDVVDRLGMGDPGSGRANRVLHIAFLGDRPVGCMSSTFKVPWAENGCGHWGLLVVDVEMQGKGIASKMVAAAEARLAGMSQQIQIEYEYTPGDELSEKLLAWYEGRLAFRCVSGPPSKQHAEFRKCRKVLSEEEQQQGRRLRLLDLRAELAAELATLQGTVPTASDDID